MDVLNEIELTLLSGLIAKYPSLKSHITHLKVSERKATGIGLYVNLEYENFNGEFENLNALFSNQENIQIPGLERGLCYLIDVTDGEIKYIEFVTYDENWNGDLSVYKIVKTA